VEQDTDYKGDKSYLAQVVPRQSFDDISGGCRSRLVVIHNIEALCDHASYDRTP
jgi:hypothetical protein